MKALVLGATGMIGSEVCRALADDGWTVTGAARMSRAGDPDRLAAMGVTPMRFDVLEDDPGTLPDTDLLLLEIWDPAHPEHIWPINFHGVGRVVERYRGCADVVNGSTINVYGDGPDPPDEHAPCRPTSEYGRSRFAQERLIDFFCAAGNRRAIHVRYAHTNSATRGMVRRCAENIAAEESLGKAPDARIQVIALEDVVRVTVEAVSRLDSTPPAVNCCHPRVWTRRELARRIRDELGLGKVVFSASRGGEKTSAYASAQRMCDWFGPPRIPLERVFRRAADAVRPLLA